MLAEFERLQKPYEDTFDGFPENKFVAEGIDSRVYRFKFKRQEMVCKIYKGRSCPSLDQIRFYQQITNQISQDTQENGLIVEHDGVKIPFYVLPIEEIGEIKTWSRKIPFSISQFIKGHNLGGIFVIDNRRKLKESQVLKKRGLNEKVMTSLMYRCEKMIKDKYQINGADLGFANLKPVINRNSVSIVVTDICTSIRNLSRIREGY